MSGITIIGVKVVGLCSKCRKFGDEIPRDVKGNIIPDKDISCVITAFADHESKDDNNVKGEVVA